MQAKVKITGIEELKKNMRGYLDKVGTRKEKQKVLLAGGKVLRNAAKLNIKDAENKHYYYPKGGKGRIEVKPGNLRQSMYVFKQKTGDVAVGPRVIRRIAGVMKTIGETPKTSSGFYAAMLYNKAKFFKEQVTDAALLASLTRINNAMQKAFQRIHRQWAKKYKF